MNPFTLETSEEWGVQEQLEWFKAIVSSIHDGVLVIDREGVVKLINPEYTRITGVTPERIIGKPLRSVRPGAQLIEILGDGKARVGVYRREGKTEYVVDMAPVVMNNQIIGAVSICKGLTEVHKLSQELKNNREKLVQLERAMGSYYQAKYTFDQIIGAHGGLKDVVHIAKKTAESKLPVLIIGESGTGKELFAQAIHNESDRRDRPFVAVNCAAIPSALLESELFGYEEGSFTNAKKGGKMGLFELANFGTIFLDEIAELPYELQAKLLRVLQEQSIRRVGETRERKIDLRVIAATNKDLQQLVEKRLFREDLFYRLNVITMKIPPLRERLGDLKDLISSFTQASTRNRTTQNDSAYTVSEETLAFLKEYDWPGNVRELRNTIDYGICMTDGMEIKPVHLPEFILKTVGKPSQLVIPEARMTLREVVEQTEERWITEIVQKYGEDLEGRRKAAEHLGVSLATLYNKMKKYNLNILGITEN